MGCEAGYKPTIVRHANGSTTKGCKSIVKKRRTPEQKAYDARRRGKKLNAVTKQRMSKGQKNRAKHG